jgi:hypothetical protein
MPLTTSFESLRAAPAKTVLLGLTALVLVGHWLALGGRVDLWPDRWFKTPSQLGALPSTAPANAEAPVLTPLQAKPEVPAPVTIATVRWISPPPPPPEPAPPEPDPTPPSALPVKIAKKPPAPEPEPVIETPVEEPLPVPATRPDPVPIAVETPLPLPMPLPQLESDGAPVAQQAPPAEPMVNAMPVEGSKANASPPMRPVTLAPNASLNYDVKGKAKGFNYTAGGTLAWKQDGAKYTAQLEVSAFLLGTYTQTSTGRVTPQGLVPERFSIKRRSGEKAAHFDPANGRIRYSNNAPDAPLLPDAQDQLSVTLQLASLLNTYANLGGARTVSLPVSSDSASEPWQFEVGAIAVQKLPAGDIKARLLTRAPRRDYDKTVQLWLAPELGHLPVRMRITEQNGDFLDLLLEDMPSIAGDPSAPQLSLPTSQ